MELKELKEMGQQKASSQIAEVLQFWLQKTVDFAGQSEEMNVVIEGKHAEVVEVKK